MRPIPAGTRGRAGFGREVPAVTGTIARRHAQSAMPPEFTSGNPAIASPIGRNDPCPCGSGLRYKQCHGALPAAAPAAEPDAVPPDVLARRGLDAHKRNDLDAAERDYRAALAKSPDHAGALHYLGVVLYQRNRPAEAMPLLDRAVALAPRRTRVPQQPRARARGAATRRRGHRRVPARARADSRPHDRVEQPGPRAAGHRRRGRRRSTRIARACASRRHSRSCTGTWRSHFCCKGTTRTAGPSTSGACSAPSCIRVIRGTPDRSGPATTPPDARCC